MPWWLYAQDIAWRAWSWNLTGTEHGLIRYPWS